MHCYLGTRPADTDLRPEIGLDLIGGLARLGKIFDLDDSADSQLNNRELVPGNLLYGCGLSLKMLLYL